MFGWHFWAWVNQMPKKESLICENMHLVSSKKGPSFVLSGYVNLSWHFSSDKLQLCVSRTGRVPVVDCNHASPSAWASWRLNWIVWPLGKLSSTEGSSCIFKKGAFWGWWSTWMGLSLSGWDWPHHQNLAVNVCTWWAPKGPKFSTFRFEYESPGQVELFQLVSWASKGAQNCHLMSFTRAQVFYFQK